MQERRILLFGAGKSATELINYLIANASSNNWRIIIADANKELILSKTNNSSFCEAVEIDVLNNSQTTALIQSADIVISLMPPALHYLIADACILLEKNLLTASYVDDAIEKRKKEIEEKKIFFLCEMGLDPGIDHMSAMQIIDTIKEKGGTIQSFKSHCGGLIAPESDNNPWHYKISWNPRNIVMAGKAGAIYKMNGNTIKEEYEELFEDVERGINIDPIGFLSYYPNRDSSTYASIYSLDNIDTFLRSTLRYPDFIYGWNNIIELKLTDDNILYDTDGMSLATFFKQHMTKVNFGNWLNNKLEQRLEFVKKLSEDLNQLIELEEEQNEITEENPEFEKVEDFSIVKETGDIEKINIEEMKMRAANAIAHKMHEANLTLKQLFYLGMEDDTTIINKGKCTAADVLQFCLETKLALQADDKDMIVMQHEIIYEMSNTTYEIKSELIVKGEDHLHTAMAKTVGLPLGIAAKLILDGAITLKGLHIPIHKEIYEPVLKELKAYGIIFKETQTIL